MSQLTVRQGLRGILRALSQFADDDVTLSNWDILDDPGAAAAAPFVILPPPETFTSGADIGGGETVWQMPLLLFPAWDKNNDTWQDILEEHAAIVQVIVDGLWAASAPTTNSGIMAIRAVAAPVEDATGVLAYVTQPIIVEVEEW